MRVQPFQLRSFGEGPQENLEEGVTAPTTVLFTEEDLSQVRDSAYKQGYEQGLLETQGKFDAQSYELDMTIQNVARSIVLQIGELQTKQEQFLQKQSQQLSRLVIGIARKVAGEALKNDPIPEIEKTIIHCLPVIFGSSKVIIYAHPSVTEALNARLIQALKGQEIEWKLEADAGLELENCRLEWNNGEAARDVESLWQEIEGMIAHADFF